MKLHLAAAIGRARTDVAASDAARLAAGVGDLNVVPLSWIIPPGTEIVPTGRCGLQTCALVICAFATEPWPDRPASTALPGLHAVR